MIGSVEVRLRPGPCPSPSFLFILPCTGHNWRGARCDTQDFKRFAEAAIGQSAHASVPFVDGARSIVAGEGTPLTDTHQ